MQAVPPELVVVVGGGVEWVVVGGGVELVVGGGVELVVGGGVECVVVGAALVVVAGVEVVAAVVCVVWCGFGLALGFGLAGFLAVVVVVNGLAAVDEVDDAAPQPAATTASETALTQRIGSRFICIVTTQ